MYSMYIEVRAMTFGISLENLRYRVMTDIFPCFAIWNVELRRGKKYDYRGAIKVIRTNYRALRCNNNVMARDDTVSCEFTACRLSPIISRDSPLSSRENDNTRFHADCFAFRNARSLSYRIIELLHLGLPRSSKPLDNFIYHWGQAHSYVS
jgi:hypothetical protein